MKKTDRSEIYQPLIERTLDNYQMQHLARKYDFGKESLVSKLIIERINKTMDDAEEVLGIVRVKPFCLYLKNKNQMAILPLFSPEYLDPLLNGKSFNEAKSMLVDKLFKIYNRSFVKKNRDNFLSIVNSWSVTRLRNSGSYKKNFLKNPALMTAWTVKNGASLLKAQISLPR